jgi:hypothetical protein
MKTLLEHSIEMDDPFLRLVDFKWLMIGLGWRVDLSRFLRDPAYACVCVQRGLASDSELLRQCSIELPTPPLLGIAIEDERPW